MMGTLQVIFWVSVLCIAYAYVLYPLLVAVRSAVRPAATVERAPAAARAVSIVIAARNEQASVARRCNEFIASLRNCGVDGEVIIVSDGSTDDTADIVRKLGARNVRVVELPENRGKAAALNAGVNVATGDLIFFADVRQTWDANCLQLMSENFADPRVGAVSGDLVIESAPGVMAGVGLYWRFEKWLRIRESLMNSMVGATGAISAVRRELFHPIPPGTILDDVYWPLRVAMSGFRVVHDERAKAFDRHPEHARDEFRRKVRTLSGNFQLAASVPSALLPWRNPVWLQFVSHKLLRLAVPWAMLAALASSAILGGRFYLTAFGLQVALYLIGLLGAVKSIGTRVRLLSAISSFLLLNAAAWVAFWVWMSGQSSKSWKRVSYSSTPGTGAASGNFA